jgi:N-acetylmuramoyl-L-alanine amidase
MRAPTFLAIVLAVAASTAAQASAGTRGVVAPDSSTLVLSRPRVTTYGRAVSIKGVLKPAQAGVYVDLVRRRHVVARTQTAFDGRFSFAFRLRDPGPYRVLSGNVRSVLVVARIRPVLNAPITGDRIVGQELVVHGGLRPCGAGKLRLVVNRSDHHVVDNTFASCKSTTFSLPQVHRYSAWVEVVPSRGYARVGRRFRFSVGAPRLYQGSRGHAVLVLERTLAAHQFALSNVDSVFGYDTLEAVYALQKLTGLPRTGIMTATVWTALARLRPPRPRLHGDYIEVDKTRQVLFVVRASKVALIIPVSTGATGNTPIGLFHVYSKVPGGAVMYYANYFTGAFAVHGYVYVPPYPASHGCVRVPMCFAIRLYGLIPLNSRVYIHY